MAWYTNGRTSTGPARADGSRAAGGPTAARAGPTGLPSWPAARTPVYLPAHLYTGPPASARQSCESDETENLNVADPGTAPCRATRSEPAPSADRCAGLGPRLALGGGRSPGVGPGVSRASNGDSESRTHWLRSGGSESIAGRARRGAAAGRPACGPVTPPVRRPGSGGRAGSILGGRSECAHHTRDDTRDRHTPVCVTSRFGTQKRTGRPFFCLVYDTAATISSGVVSADKMQSHLQSSKFVQKN